MITPAAIGAFMAWLSLHHDIAYTVLFLGAYFETVFGPSFFIPGELFLWSGSILGGMHTLSIVLVAVALYGGSVLGDSTSYFIGASIHPSIFKEGNKIFSRTLYKKGERFFEKYSSKAIFLARLIGPLSKIIPFFAGLYRVPYTTFLKYNVPGVVLSVSQFLILGYLFGTHYRTMFWLAERYFLLVTVGILLYILWRYNKSYARISAVNGTA